MQPPKQVSVRGGAEEGAAGGLGKVPEVVEKGEATWYNWLQCQKRVKGVKN